MHEGKEKGSGGLLAITVNPEACKGCNICVDVCADGALVTIKQDDDVVDRLRRNWSFWKKLPDTEDRFINIRNLDEGIGVLPSLLLKKDNYMSMVGGDGACMGCGEKTSVHLVTSTIEALVQPRVAKFVGRIDGLVAGLDRKARELLASDADIDVLAMAEGGLVDVPVSDEKRTELSRIVSSMKVLKDLKWRYEEGPSGRGRSALGITNSTGCSSVWASTYPFNPYPFPWVNHLFQDAPSVAIGIFEGHMRKMGDAFIAVRRAEKLLDGSYDEAKDETFFTQFDWRQFTDEEFHLVPPILAIGGDGAMLDIGFQNLSRLLASGKPIRVVMLDTQVYSNTGGQASTGTFTGQSADMSPHGKAIAGQVRGAEGAGVHRHRPPRRLRAPELAGVGQPPDRGCDQGAQQPPAGRLQPLHAVPGGARAAGRVGAHRRAPRPGEPGVPVRHVRPGRRRHAGRLHQPRWQPERRRAVAALRAEVRGRLRRREEHGAAPDDRRLGGDGDALQQAVQGGARGPVERGHGPLP
jgi:ferredoxin